MEIFLYILAGASVGFAIGLTGVGGGSLMTPMLLSFGIPPHIAIGTDLWYATVTKAGGVVYHRKMNTIRVRIVLQMAAGSIPASLLTSYVLKNYFPSPEVYSFILTKTLGFMLIVTALAILFKSRLQKQSEKTPPSEPRWYTKNSGVITFAMGLILGVLVTLSSVGAGAFGTAILMTLFPLLPTIHVIGTDLAHAVLLTFTAGLGHFATGNVDLWLLSYLLVGSIPATYAGARMSTRLPEQVIRPLLAITLFILGLVYTINGVGH